MQLIHTLWHDNNGFLVSAELILVSTIAVLGLVVGLSEVANAINQELEDVASAFGSINQTFHYHGYHGCKGRSAGSKFHDSADQCDNDCDIVCSGDPQGEGSHSW